jgi:PAS domain S-box-containing protein
MIARLRTFLDGPGTMLGQVRRIFLSACLAWILLAFPLAARRLTLVEALVATLLLVALVGWGYLGYRRLRFPAWSWIAEGALLGAVRVLCDHSGAVILVLLWANFRATYGTRRETVLGGSVIAATILVPGLSGHATVGTVVPTALTAVLAILTMHLLAETSASRASGAARERAITAAGAAFAAATSRADAVNTALVTALGMDTGVGAAVVAIGSGTQLRVEGMVGRGTTERDHVIDFAELPASALEALVPGGHALLRGEDAEAMARVLAVEPTAGAVLAPLAVQGTVFGLLVLALDRVPADDLCTVAATLADTVAITLDQLLTGTRLRVVVEHSPDALFLTDVAGTVRFGNPAAATLLGLSEDELAGLPLHSVAHPEDAASLGAEHLGLPRPVRFRGPDGDWIETETVAERVLERDGSSSVVVTVRDVSERQRLELELRHAQKLESVGRLAAGVAHEINTPIQFIGDNVRFLGESVDGLIRLHEAYRELVEAIDDPARRTEALARVERVAQDIDVEFVLEEVPGAITQTLDGIGRVATIVRAMKSFGHPGNDEKTDVDLNEAISSTLVVAANEVKYVAQVETELGELPFVRCHRGDINQVVLNLVINAAHAIAACSDERGQGTIRVRTRAEAGWAVIEVSDTGTGIDPAIADKVYDQFFTTKEVGSGTGQGLALAHSLVVDRHGGTIDFTSEVGVGTTFVVQLPLAERDAVPATPELAARR